MPPSPPIRSPDLYPHSLDVVSDTVYMVRFTEADYVRASFLDERALQPTALSEWMPYASLARDVDAADLQTQCGFIFHIGHVGSTLLSRLIGTQPNVLSVREPLPFRTLAQAQMELQTAESAWSTAEFNRRLDLFLKLWSRTFRGGQLPVVKATSFCSELAATVLARPFKPRAIALSVAPEVYLATIFAGQNNYRDIRGMATNRLRRLHRRIGQTSWRLHELSYGEMIAMSWAAETTALAESAEAGDRVMWLDFDDLLAAPREILAKVFRHLDREVNEVEIEKICRGPDLYRYSKAPEHGYDAQLRRTVLDQARREHASEIRAGMAWLERAASKFPIIGAVAGLERAA
jgi:hypothetical protein